VKVKLLIALLCATALPIRAQTVATVNGKKIPAARVDAMVKQAVSQGQADTPQLRAAAKEQSINQELLFQEAEKRGFAANAEVKEQLEQARQTIIIRSMVLDYVKKNPVSDAAIQAEYDRFKAQPREREYLARHILVDSEAVAKSLIAQLNAGAKFEELAKVSKDGSANNGGILNWSPASRYVKPFADALVALKNGELTQTPVKSQFGYHVIRLDSIREPQVPQLPEIRQQIAQSLQEKKLQAMQDSLRKKATIK
jgi:peptidyl-prolyl cis-trans isomerase C